MARVTRTPSGRSTTAAPLATRSTHFTTDFRQRVTSGGPLTWNVHPSAIVTTAGGFGDPIFSPAMADANVYFNFYYSNNGARLLLDGQLETLPGVTQNTDNAAGLVRRRRRTLSALIPA